MKGSCVSPPSAEVLGAPVHVVDLPQVLRMMEEWIEERDRPRWIAVTGSHGALEAYKRPDFRTVLHSAELSIPDGMWAARVAAKKLACQTRQVRGADLLAAFCNLSCSKGYSSYFFGDTEETLALASQRLQSQYLGLRIVGAYSPPFRALTAEEDAQVVAEINRANPDVLWVALGLPKQENWIFAHRGQLRAPVIVAIGAALKFHSGRVKPAPAWASRLGFEWLWRVFHEPRRTWHRAFVCGPQFAALSLWELARHRKPG